MDGPIAEVVLVAGLDEAFEYGAAPVVGAVAIVRPVRVLGIQVAGRHGPWPVYQVTNPLLEGNLPDTRIQRLWTVGVELVAIEGEIGTARARAPFDVRLVVGAGVVYTEDIDLLLVGIPLSYRQDHAGTEAGTVFRLGVHRHVDLRLQASTVRWNEDYDSTLREPTSATLIELGLGFRS